MHTGDLCVEWISSELTFFTFLVLSSLVSFFIGDWFMSFWVDKTLTFVRPVFFVCTRFRRPIIKLRHV